MSKQLYKVHLLPTDSENPTDVACLLLPQKGKLYRHVAGGEFRKGLQMGHKPQHLYFTSNEEIKKGDKFISVNPNTAMQGVVMTCTGINHLDELICKEDLHTVRGWHRSNVGKIVATTNKNLWCSGLKRDGASCSKNNLCTFPTCNGAIAKINTQYIEEYIKLFNEGKVYEISELESVLHA